MVLNKHRKQIACGLPLSVSLLLWSISTAQLVNLMLLTLAVGALVGQGDLHVGVTDVEEVSVAGRPQLHSFRINNYSILYMYI